jgi:cytochrome c-type biogenesis protein CcmF
MLDVYRDGKKQFQMTPEKRVYLASNQPQTMVAIHSTPEWDLYVVYEGTNPDTSQPIIKAYLNPLVGWIWAGLVILVFGTFVALVPSLTPATAALRVPATRPAPTEPELKGGL